MNNKINKVNKIFLKKCKNNISLVNLYQKEIVLLVLNKKKNRLYLIEILNYNKIIVINHKINKNSKKNNRKNGARILMAND